MTEVIIQPEQLSAPDFGLTKFLDPLHIPPVIGPHLWWRQEEITVRALRTRVRLHSQLPETEVWAYEGEFPGPTIEVRSGKQLRVAWTNEVQGTMPLVAVQGPIAQAPGDVPGGYRDAQGNLLPGFSLIDGVADLPPWHVVHLHGAMTGGGNDGWAHNAVLPGFAQLAEYPNGQQSTTMWYHDHAMAVTRFNVHAGLAGMYLIRDAEEDALDLPHGKHEIPLILCDRNLDTDATTGRLSGRLLFKIAVAPGGAAIPFTGPFNLVNGTIWPHLDVERRWYRFRVLNAANSRFYQLNLIDEAGAKHNDAVRIIGTDGGLLPAPAELPAAGLTLAPAERADVLIDFSRFAGERLRLTDTGVTGPTEPDLMEFRVENSPRHNLFYPPAKLSVSYFRLQHGTTVPDDHDHVFVALVPPGTAGEAHPQMWELRELTAAPSVPAQGILQVKDPSTGVVRTFEKVASLFDDTTTFFIDHGRWAVWNLIHFGGPTHPVHIHMTQLQLLTRKQFPLTQGNVAGFDVTVGGTTAPLEVPPDGRPIEKYEEGWKDTFQVRAGEWVTVAGLFEGATGEFMYHCHILDHEDEGMMRPFVVHPPEVAKFHLHPGGAGHGGH
ncbi:multicopper oxidase family protein [Amycolatopsis sp. GM8]|uniref:multicopper oxidase family protein n=1 Tax=Amycolatopsis sp. GM8 TaxID=2896530 RepID=UPI001F229AB6|nr:multicopper oxidase domain-containing protein [Amycolatopsis sp. GM8]